MLTAMTSRYWWPAWGLTLIVLCDITGVWPEGIGGWLGYAIGGLIVAAVREVAIAREHSTEVTKT